MRKSADDRGKRFPYQSHRSEQDNWRASYRGSQEDKGDRFESNHWASTSKNVSRDNRRENVSRTETIQRDKIPKRARYMGFTYIEELLKNEDIEDIVLKLSNDRNGFKELLNTRNISNDMVVLLVKLLSKICACSFMHSKIFLLEVALTSHFIDSLINFVTTLPLQSDREKKNNCYFWNDPDEFWNNVICISRTVNNTIPTTSCEIIFKILKAIKIYIPLMENYHSIHISDFIKSNIESLYEIVEKTSFEVEKNHTSNTKKHTLVELEPPDDFREINVYPNVTEVTTSNAPFLRPNIVEGPYKSINHYLDVQYRLLREDFVTPLRLGICKYMKNPKDKLDDIKIYNPIRFLNMEIVNEQNCYRIQFDFSKKKTFRYENSRRFMFGSLLCFTQDNFKTVIFGKIVQRNITDLQIGQLIVGFSEEISLPENLFQQKYLMVESRVYFEPYYQVLNVLKKMQSDNFPMERYIIKVETETRPPDYLLQIDPVFYHIDDHIFWPLYWDRQIHGLNDAQHSAFKAALTQEFSIIQGPPGTGKTFLGLKIAHTLLRNQSAWYNETPLLVICYTNHALDQFLEGILKETQNIIRVGNQSKNENLNKYNLRYRRRLTTYPVVADLRYKVRRSIQEFSTINETLKQIEANESIIDFSVFYEVTPHYRNSWFSRVMNNDILGWLFGQRQSDNAQLNMNDMWLQMKNDVGSSNTVNSSNENYSLEELELNEEDLDIHENIVADKYVSLISLKDLESVIKTLEGKLTALYESDERWLGNVLQEEELVYHLSNAKRDFQYLQRRLFEGAKRTVSEEPSFVNLQNPHMMPPVLRWQLYWFWLDQYKLKLLGNKEILCKHFQKIYKRYCEMREIEDTRFMKTSLVVGITTTGAARLQATLQSLKSPIVIVEEAAEVLEAHIVSSLTSHCKHLILIGDHQQLKPSTANFKIETKYLLGVSLFERMVLNNIECHRLNIQHRMRPEISCLIRPSIYPVLEDHESVLDRPSICGVDNCVYFIDHQEPEQLCNDNSKKNVHEAKFLINFAKHLILNGYKPENITILVAYLGQMFEIQHEKDQHRLLLQDVRVAVLDNYQGEESDIILLSLVRNNDENKIGFLKIENRVCVALSRARNGMYIMGNMAQLCESSDIWPKIKESLVKQNAIGSYLTLRCQIHQHKTTHVKTADDFMHIPEGGCDLMCEAQISCGHICKRLCHIYDKDHTSYECKEKCKRTLCENMAHICQKLCYVECGHCTYKVEHTLECGHTVTIYCYLDPTSYKCTVDVETVLPCGHEAKKPCYMDPEKFRCPYPCEIQVQPCGHACERTCHINMDPDHLEYRCLKPCARKRVGCTLKDDEEHLCSKKCYEKCEECVIEMQKHRTVCPHVYTVPCNVNVDSIACKRPCKKTLACGHKCKNACDEPCGNCNVKVDKIIPECNHKVPMPCSQEPNRKFCNGKCLRLLDCGHKCTKKCSEQCTTTFCNDTVECTKQSICGHTIKSIKCGAKNIDDPKALLIYCTEKCNSKLKCEHICSGTCGECFQGRIHQRCKEKCGVPLICNHECPIPCRQACKPCQKKCTTGCIHCKCPKKCGDPCIPCKEQCTRKCKHQQCRRKCGAICNILPCSKPCDKRLECGHGCVGFCGDPCPTLCRICNYEELTDIFLGNEAEENAIYVMLVDCGHIFESSDMEQWLKSNNNQVNAKVCPKCKTPIVTTQRYSEYVKRSMYDITNIKKISFGTTTEIDKEKAKLLSELALFQNQINKTKLFLVLEDMHTSLYKLEQMLQISVKKKDRMRRQSVSRMDLEAVRSKKRIIEYIVDVCSKQDFDMQPTDKSAIHISFILSILMRDTHITDQELEDLTLEIQRLSRIAQFDKLQKTSNFQCVKTKDEIKLKVQQILELLESPQRYCDKTDDILQANLSTLNKIIDSSVVITETERRQIVNAIGMKKGHWFKCPNGHYYVIGDCGGANQVSRCNECGSQIGGQSHRLLPGQSHAPEMDGSQYPAWSEAANLGNYRL